jgi:hypothetical protein
LVREHCREDKYDGKGGEVKDSPPTLQSTPSIAHLSSNSVASS